MRFVMSQLPSTEELSPWLLVAVGALVILALLLIRLRRRTPNAAHHGLQGELHALTHELSAMINSAEAQLDARAQRIERLLQAADERITTLQRLSTENHHPSDSPADDAPDALSIPAETDSRHALIYHLSAEGLSIQQIADQLGRPRGEVELILALRPRDRAAG